MSNIRIEAADPASGTVVIEVWQRGAAGQPDALVQTLAPSPAALPLGPDRYFIVRDPDTVDTKSIDNWAVAPPPPPAG